MGSPCHWIGHRPFFISPYQRHSHIIYSSAEENDLGMFFIHWLENPHLMDPHPQDVTLRWKLQLVLIAQLNPF